jgi:polysaccharide pyruvyl transferase WcaK-like protein
MANRARLPCVVLVCSFRSDRLQGTPQPFHKSCTLSLMRIVVEPGSYTCMNMGDVAMMQVCVSRLAELWPGAHIGIVTQSPERLALFCPNAFPITESGKEYWFQDKLFGRVLNFLPPVLRRRMQESEIMLRNRCPVAFSSLLSMKRRIMRLDCRGLSDFVKAVFHSDLVVASGSGMINDEFRNRALQMLATLEMADQYGIPTAMVSQGIGPVSDPGLLAAMRTVLPKVGIISLRDRLQSQQILKIVDYPSDRVVLVGDDGLQLAFENRSDVVGSAIGVNLRVANYSQIEASIVSAVRHALESVASKLNLSFIPVPILFRDETDLKAAAALISGHQDRSSGAPVMTPLDVIQRISRCRLVMTGSYHGAVFALGQGIPAIAVAKSQYYLGKFRGLEEQFGEGCQLIDWSNHVDTEELICAIDRAWISAAALRPVLLRVAEHQIRNAADAYRKLHASVSCARQDTV